MKTKSKSPKKFKRERPAHRNSKEANDEEVAVLVDTKSGAEYYMFMIDEFMIGNNTYAVMVPYEPDRIHTRDAQIVILRSRLSKSGDRLYFSILNKKELKAAFEIFYKRYEESDKQ